MKKINKETIEKYLLLKSLEAGNKDCNSVIIEKLALIESVDEPNKFTNTQKILLAVVEGGIVAGAMYALYNLMFNSTTDALDCSGYESTNLDNTVDEILGAGSSIIDD
jgi:hypothetical protein